MGKLQMAVGQKECMIVATNYFTKWVKAEPVSRIRDSEEIKLF